jgi:hypothetical protein
VAGGGTIQGGGAKMAMSVDSVPWKFCLGEAKKVIDKAEIVFCSLHSRGSCCFCCVTGLCSEWLWTRDIFGLWC